ncbi:MAG: hypothetical protein DWH91_08830 [Planctomycetota bacterium]|nr:MAG: hypothetical protein DWH91_08830 [Planctomycetota bacterium]
MTNCPQSAALLQKVGKRIYFAQLAWRTYLGFLGTAAVALAFTLFVRLTSLVPEGDWWIRAVLVAAPVLALLLGIVLTRRPALVEAARRVDAACETHDLFLTVTKIASTAGDYQPLVTGDAEQTAPRIQPEKVRTLNPREIPGWGRRLGKAGTLVSLALLAMLIPPQDPFGKEAEAKEQAILVKQLEQTRKATELRKETLAKVDSESELSQEVEASLHKLLQDLKVMKKAEPLKNDQALNTNQRNIGEQFRNTSKTLQEMMKNMASQQEFGQQTSDEMRKMAEELHNGKAESMAKKMQETQEKLERLMKEEDPLKRSEMVQQLKKELDQMSKFAGKQAGSPGMKAALERALDQLEQSKGNPELAADALQAAQQSMELAQMELKELEQSVRDLQSLEEALKTIADAKKRNSEGELDGEMAADASTLEEYQQLYEDLMAQMNGEGEGEGEGQGEGEGNGLGGEGMGRGSKAPEDPNAKTGFKGEKSQTAIKKGKILLSMKTKDAPNAKEEDREATYSRIITDIKQATDEAIIREQAPPGYHDRIKKYFDTLDRTPESAKP